MKHNRSAAIKYIAKVAVLAAAAVLLMMFEFPLAFIVPTFYGLDLSEVPVLVGAFSMGPVAGVIIEFVKILVKLMMKPTTTGFVGEMANFVIGCSLVLPAAIIYHTKKSKKSAMYGMIVGTIFMALSGIVINAVVMLPFYSKVMPLESIIALGAGGITKVYYPDENRLERVPNVSNYEIYIERIEEMLERKSKDLFQEVTLC